MIYNDNINKAMRICFKMHKGQVDRSKVPYVFHPFHIAEQMGNDENAIIVALLHDVIEDSKMSLETLITMDFSPDIVAAIETLTKPKSCKSEEDYYEYIRQIAKNPLAKKVKIADLEHNSDLSRLTKISDNDIARRDKYINALKILKNS